MGVVTGARTMGAHVQRGGPGRRAARGHARAQLPLAAQHRVAARAQAQRSAIPRVGLYEYTCTRGHAHATSTAATERADGARQGERHAVPAYLRAALRW